MSEEHPQRNDGVWGKVAILIAVIVVICGLLIYFSSSPNITQKKNELKSAVIIDVMDSTAKTRLSTNFIASNPNEPSIVLNTSERFAESVQFYDVPYQVTIFKQGYFDTKSCIWLKNTKPLDTFRCLYRRDCDSGYSCINITYFNKTVQVAGRNETKEYISKGYCHLNLPVSCDTLCSADKCEFFLKKIAVVQLSYSAVDNSSGILSLNKADNEYFNFPYELCISYSAFQFKTISVVDMAKKQMNPNPIYDKCYDLQNQTALNISFFGNGTIDYWLNRKDKFTFAT